MKIQVALFKGRGNWLNKLICWWTKSRYSHAELVLSDDKTWLGISPFLKSKVDSREKLIVDNLEWDFVYLDVTSEQHDIILEFFEETKGFGYDWVGMMLSQFSPCRIKHKKRWYCSEWIAYALRIACVLDWRDIKIYERRDLSPAVLYELVSNTKKP